MVELAANRAMTQYFGATTRVSDWPDGKDHPELQNVRNPFQIPERFMNIPSLQPSGQCITDPNCKLRLAIFPMWNLTSLLLVHTTSENAAAGTAFSISYTVRFYLITTCIPSDMILVRHPRRYRGESGGLQRSPTVSWLPCFMKTYPHTLEKAHLGSERFITRSQKQCRLALKGDAFVL